MATRIYTPHHEVHQSVITLPKAVQELLIRHLLEPGRHEAAPDCDFCFQIGCPKSVGFICIHIATSKLAPYQLQLPAETSYVHFDMVQLVCCKVLDFVVDLYCPSETNLPKVAIGATIGVCQGTVWIHKMEWGKKTYVYIFIHIQIQIHIVTRTTHVL